MADFPHHTLFGTHPTALSIN